MTNKRKTVNPKSMTESSAFRNVDKNTIMNKIKNGRKIIFKNAVSQSRDLEIVV